LSLYPVCGLNVMGHNTGVGLTVLKRSTRDQLTEK
jgi:hypothetical protein